MFAGVPVGFMVFAVTTVGVLWLWLWGGGEDGEGV